MPNFYFQWWAKLPFLDSFLPVQVTKGLNDGAFTEINGNVKVGDKVATGINQNATPDDSKKASSPFLPKFNSKKK